MKRPTEEECPPTADDALVRRCKRVSADGQRDIDFGIIRLDPNANNYWASPEPSKVEIGPHKTFAAASAALWRYHQQELRNRRDELKRELIETNARIALIVGTPARQEGQRPQVQVVEGNA